MWLLLIGGVIFFIFLVIVLGIIAYLILTYNKLVTLTTRINNSKSQIEVQLKRRYDLIPNLVETVKGYAKHEKGIFEKVAQLRSGLINGPLGERLKKSNQLTQFLGRLFAVAENYPELKANENFKQLQSQLTETENKIAYSRMVYNDVVMQYDKAIKLFPTNLIAGILGFKEKEYFKAEENEKKNVKVSF